MFPSCNNQRRNFVTAKVNGSSTFHKFLFFNLVSIANSSFSDLYHAYPDGKCVSSNWFLLSFVSL